MNQNYSEINVNYKNHTAEIKLAGTLTLPTMAAPCPAVVLIPGYGPSDRNATFAGKQPFKMIADDFASKGIAVLRYDKRGVGESTGDYNNATSRDFADDVKAGIGYLKTDPNINHAQIGLVGISEGGFIAAIVAAESSEVNFVVLLAAAVMSKVDDFVAMSSLQMLADGVSQEFIDHDEKLRTQVFTTIKQAYSPEITENKLRQLVNNYLVELTEAEIKEAEKTPFAFKATNAEQMIKTFNSTWYRYFLSCDPAEFLKQIRVPVLALNGDLDWISAPSITFPIMEKAFITGNVKDYTFIEAPHINHMFQVCKTGAIAEYSTIKEVISPIVLNIISDWIKSRTK
ncbi:MAG TPA: alpha/beta fold hydrolase [Candidatus Babeliales bacterium]|nr:alpha/beta fold hydrolase [Candidatus Babeliales bacterium]